MLSFAVSFDCQTGSRALHTEGTQDDAAAAAMLPLSFAPRKIKQHQVAGSKVTVEAETGILPRMRGALSSRRLQDESCVEGFVDCVAGKVDGTSTECATACGDACCEGEHACEGFTGSVCKDGVSCSGRDACYEANILSVVGSCCYISACVYAGGSGSATEGSIGNMKDSCIGYKACNRAAYEGRLGDLLDSCDDYFACDSAA